MWQFCCRYTRERRREARAGSHVVDFELGHLLLVPVVSGQLVEDGSTPTPLVVVAGRAAFEVDVSVGVCGEGHS